MSEELKSCPFCGGNSIDHFMNWSVPSIGCDTCGAAIGGKDEEMVIKKWNTRASSAAPKVDVTRLGLKA